MIAVLNIGNAKKNFSRIVAEAAAGKEVVISKAGRPMARLMPLNRSKTPVNAVKRKRFGTLAGKIDVPDNFNDALPVDILASFGIDTETVIHPDCGG